MKIRTDIQQGTLEWLSARAGIVTASEFGEFLTNDLKPRTGEMRKSYIARKVAERIFGPLPSHNTLDMDLGKILEEEAIPWFEFEKGLKVDRPGFVTSDDGMAGCSPDGLIVAGNIGLEIKCPRPETHIGYLLKMASSVKDETARDWFPPHYAPQVLGSMSVTGLRDWVFVSYCRKLPPLVARIFWGDWKKEIAQVEACLADMVLEIETETAKVKKMK